MNASTHFPAIKLESQTTRKKRGFLCFLKQRGDWCNHCKWLFNRAFLAQDNPIDQKIYSKRIDLIAFQALEKALRQIIFWLNRSTAWNKDCRSWNNVFSISVLAGAFGCGVKAYFEVKNTSLRCTISYSKFLHRISI